MVHSGFSDFSELPHLLFLSASFLIFLYITWTFFLHHSCCFIPTQFSASFPAFFSPQCEILTLREVWWLSFKTPQGPGCSILQSFHEPLVHTGHWDEQNASQSQLLCPNSSTGLCRENLRTLLGSPTPFSCLDANTMHVDMNRIQGFVGIHHHFQL